MSCLLTPRKRVHRAAKDCCSFNRSWRPYLTFRNPIYWPQKYLLHIDSISFAAYLLPVEVTKLFQNWPRWPKSSAASVQLSTWYPILPWPRTSWSLDGGLDTSPHRRRVQHEQSVPYLHSPKPRAREPFIWIVSALTPLSYVWRDPTIRSISTVQDLNN